MSGKHTPGPWKSVGSTSDGKGGWWVESDNRKPVALALASSGNAEANAQLIASAPELLDALKAVNPLLPEDVQVKVEALIKKATGGQ